jgi:hypothetical protein
MLDHVLGSGTIVIGSRMRPHNFYKVDGNSNVKISLEAMRDAVVLCVSGIGCPESLALILQQVGFQFCCRLLYRLCNFCAAIVLCPVCSGWLQRSYHNVGKSTVL